MPPLVVVWQWPLQLPEAQSPPAPHALPFVSRHCPGYMQDPALQSPFWLHSEPMGELVQTLLAHPPDPQSAFAAQYSPGLPLHCPW